MQLTPKTRINELLRTYPFLLDYLVGYTPKFEKLRNPILRNTFGRIATLQMAASMGDVELPKLLEDLRGAIERGAGDVLEVSAEGTGGASELERLELLKGIIRDLHSGTPVEELEQRFAALLEEVSPTEIATMEQQLMAEGLPQSEIKKLCDVHVQVFRASLDRQQKPEAVPGHPVHTFVAENRALERVAQRLRQQLEPLAARPDPALLVHSASGITATLDELAQIEKHYLRKENQLFPCLETHGIVGPPQVMWAIHDEVRALLKDTRAAVAAADASRLAAHGATLAQTVIDMIYKEDNILFPMALQILDEKEWEKIRQDEGEIGYALVTPGEQWRPAAATKTAAAAPSQPAVDRLPLDTGLLTLEQLNLMLRNLPVDITVVDENDEVRYYSEGRERVFPRSPQIIGRKVQNCHPPNSIATVNRILAEFRAGTKDVAEFWIELGGRFIHIRYFPLRDGTGRYRGCLEVTQEVTQIRALQGQRRLLDWS